MKLMGNHCATVAPIKSNTFHLKNHPHLKDSIQVQTNEKHADCVNDSEPHEDHPHLEDFLKPHQTLHVEDERSETSEECPYDEVTVETPSALRARPALPRPKTSCLHNPDCKSRSPCTGSETEAKRFIKFKEVTLREYGMILGDNPGCRFGVPVTLEWDYLEYKPLCVDEYEMHHSLRRPLKKMYLLPEKRETFLQASGYKKSDFDNAKRTVKRLRNQRFWTNERPFPLQALDTVLESLVRKTKRSIAKWRMQERGLVVIPA